MWPPADSESRQAPSRTTTMAMTIANTGRSMKKRAMFTFLQTVSDPLLLPGIAFCSPSTMTRSPVLRPWSTIQLSPTRSPVTIGLNSDFVLGPNNQDGLRVPAIPARPAAAPESTFLRSPIFMRTRPNCPGSSDLFRIGKGCLEFNRSGSRIDLIDRFLDPALVGKNLSVRKNQLQSGFRIRGRVLPRLYSKYSSSLSLNRTQITSSGTIVVSG